MLVAIPVRGSTGGPGLPEGLAGRSMRTGPRPFPVSPWEQSVVFTSSFAVNGEIASGFLFLCPDWRQEIMNAGLDRSSGLFFGGFKRQGILAHHADEQ